MQSPSGRTPGHESSAYRYCTNFVVSGGGLAPGTWVSLLEDIGDSVLVVGDATTMRVHVHTDDPAAPWRCSAVPERERLDVADMHEQQEQRAARLATESRPAVAVARCGVVAVASRSGPAGLYEQLGAHVIEGGSTLNPSTFELLAGIHEVAADEVVVLPNSANVILAAERAAELSEKDVAVVESRSTGGLAPVPRSRPRPGSSNAQRLRAARRDSAPARWRRPRATTSRAASARATRSVSSRMRWWPGGHPRRRWPGRLRRSPKDSELLTCVSGRRRPTRRRCHRVPGPRDRRDRIPRRRAAALLVAAGRRVSVAPASEPDSRSTTRDPPRALPTAALQTRPALRAVPLRSAPRPSLLAHPLTSLEGRSAEAAAKLGIETVGDLLGHLPFDYRDYADARPWPSWRPGRKRRSP